jgi:hypothetical protein
VGQLAAQAANGKEQMQPMVEAIEEPCGRLPEATLADSGYRSEENLKYPQSAPQPEREIEDYAGA